MLFKAVSTHLKKNSVLSSIPIDYFPHHLCPTCYQTLPDESIQECPNESCSLPLTADSLPLFFTVSIDSQIEAILKRMSTYILCIVTDV